MEVKRFAGLSYAEFIITVNDILPGKIEKKFNKEFFLMLKNVSFCTISLFYLCFYRYSIDSKVESFSTNEKVIPVD